MLGILNSKIFSYYIRQNRLTTRQAFPQILMTGLQEIPIPHAKENQQKEISKTENKFYPLTVMLKINKLQKQNYNNEKNEEVFLKLKKT